ncbi:MAG TPA: hypothetical protein VMZ27_03365 [Candidatus Saccharimonadales bacterium]|nr:hypothetical protein [Candidatus Saccharimonadales bacterium]
MKTKLTLLCGSLVLAAGMVMAAEAQPKAKPSSPEFERMKTMVGTWTGKTDMGQGPIDMTVQYRLVSGGSVLEEKVFSGTPNEMTTMYYEEGGKLALTHYCMLGNRPGMLLKSSDSKTLNFDFDKTCGINPKKESHMHGLTIRFDDADTVTSSCRAFMDGKETPEHPVTLKRVKS